MSKEREVSWPPSGDKCEMCRTFSRYTKPVCLTCLDEIDRLKAKLKEYEALIQREAQRRRAA